MKKLFFLGLLMCALAQLRAQALWIPVSEQEIPQQGERRIVPLKYACFRLDENLLHPILDAAPLRFSAAAQHNSTTLLIPMPDGRVELFRITESPVMAPALQDMFPQIRSYTGIGIDDPTALLKCDFTVWGFHAMIRSAKHSTVFVDPYSSVKTEYYQSHYKKDFEDIQRMECLVTEKDQLPTDKQDPVQHPDFIGDCQLRKYRLALACTGEYATFHGGTTAGVASAMTTSMNRVNGVFENDNGVTMELVANNNLLIYLNASTDPYTNSNGSTMLTENQNNCNAVIGNTNYDIGHVFSTGGGGIASLGSVCSTANKAKGVTGSSAPIGDNFDIDYVAHEMGHQFAESHTFYATTGSCGGGNISQTSAMEPGSGTTIMAYAGICGTTNNVQLHSDAYFHGRSMLQTAAFVTTGSGGNCDNIINSSNTPPSISVATTAYTIPKSTPFTLTATGSDPDGDPITFCWEQMDSTAGGASPPAATNTVGPLFRSLSPVTDGSRTFPKQSDILSGANGNTWEVLPSVARTMKFRVTIRDNHPDYGCTKEVNSTITVSGTAGPFAVTSPNTAVSYPALSTQTVTWSVNSTNTAPVSCANVKISLSIDGGTTFPYELAASTANDGTENVTMPNVTGTTCRIKIECASGNVFFDISNSNFTLTTPSVPIQLMRFDAVLDGRKQVQLDWATASERNNKGFEIEVLGGRFDLFTALGFVAGKGDSNKDQLYHYTCSGLEEGEYLFRLKQIDLDGKVEYSEVRSVKISTKIKVSAIPNPVSDQLTLQIFSETEGAAALELLNSLGQTVYSLPALDISAGENSVRVDVSQLPKGAYYYRLKKDGLRFDGKFLVR